MVDVTLTFDRKPDAPAVPKCTLLSDPNVRRTCPAPKAGALGCESRSIPLPAPAEQAQHADAAG
jgi:hypothetical protein